MKQYQKITIKKNKENKEDKLYKYIIRKLDKKYKNKKGERKRDRRPKELIYLHMAKASGLSYKQVRTRIDKLVKNGILEKYQAWSDINKRVNFYRLKD